MKEKFGISDDEQSRRAFIKGSLVASAVLVVPSFACSDDGDPEGAVVIAEWQEIADGLESVPGPCCYSAAAPPPAGTPGAGGPDNHAPRIGVDATGRVTVDMASGHPMTRGTGTTPAHWITTMYVRDQDGLVVGFRDFGQNEVTPQWEGRVPSLVFALPRGTTQIRAYAFCNLHLHWASELIAF